MSQNPANSTATYIYDETGNLTIAYPIDSDSDGTPESIFTYSYDTQGREISRTEDFDGDGSPERVITANYRYDSAGNLTIDYATDDNKDGQADSVLSYTYNTQGELIGTYDSLANPTTDPEIEAPIVVQSLLLSSSSSTTNANVSGLRKYTYDLDGNLIRLDSTVFAVSGITTSINYEYDAAGNLVKETNSFGTSFLNIYDESGNLIKRIFQAFGFERVEFEGEYDADGNLIKSGSKTFTYDESGNLLSQSIDSNLDGVPDRVEAIYSYDETGKEIRAEIDTDQDGTFDYVRVSSYTLDAENNLTREILVETANAGEGDIYTFTFDTQENPTRDTFNGQASNVNEYTYDELGNATKITNDFTGDGTVDRVEDNIYGLRLVGNSDKNVLTGTENDDILQGGAGDDILTGLGGLDRLVGGEGRDTFVLGAGADNDLIIDFSAEDLIGLSGGIGFSDLSFSGESISLIREGNAEVLATLTGIDTTLLQADQFVLI